MFHAVTPIDIFQEQIETIRSHEAGVLDGQRDSIHDARIATRRIREVLPLMHEWQRRERTDDLFTMVKRLGRALGRVRDADARLDLLRYLEARIPDAAASLVLVRQGEQQDRLRVMRKLVKRFERLNVSRELTRLARGTKWRRTSIWMALTGDWRAQLRRLVGERASAASDAVVHATGVYFPNRAHAARIDIKKFRYAAEIGVATAVLADATSLRVLKKSQDLLGDVHDRQELIDRLRKSASDDPRIDARHVALVAQAVEAEIADLHARFLERRAEIRKACDEIGLEVQPPNTVARAATIAAALAIVSGFTGLEARRRLRAHRDRESQPETAVAVRVPVPLGGASFK
jgi:CHAD domain-containing protein